VCGVTKRTERGCAPGEGRGVRSNSLETIYSRIVPSSFPSPVAELACVTRPWRPLQKA